MSAAPAVRLSALLLIGAVLLPACQVFSAGNTGSGNEGFHGRFSGIDYGKLSGTLDGTPDTDAAFESDDSPRLPPAPARPCDPWVLRCVLDQRPRMLVIALGDDLCLAYDTQSCTLAKAWRGDVNFDGPVYTTAHGPQPTSRGEDLHDPLAGSTWMLAPGKPARAQFAGYTFKEGHITLQWNLWQPGDTNLAPDATPYGCVLETPEGTHDDDGNLVLLRLFEAIVPIDRALLLQQDSIAANAWKHVEMHTSGSELWGCEFPESDAGMGFTLQLSLGQGLLWKPYENEGTP